MRSSVNSSIQVDRSSVAGRLMHNTLSEHSDRPTIQSTSVCVFGREITCYFSQMPGDDEQVAAEEHFQMRLLIFSVQYLWFRLSTNANPGNELFQQEHRYEIRGISDSVAAVPMGLSPARVNPVLVPKSNQIGLRGRDCRSLKQSLYIYPSLKNGNKWPNKI